MGCSRCQSEGNLRVGRLFDIVSNIVILILFYLFLPRFHFWLGTCHCSGTVHAGVESFSGIQTLASYVGQTVQFSVWMLDGLSCKQSPKVEWVRVKSLELFFFLFSFPQMFHLLFSADVWLCEGFLIWSSRQWWQTWLILLKVIWNSISSHVLIENDLQHKDLESTKSRINRHARNTSNPPDLSAS